MLKAAAALAVLIAGAAPALAGCQLNELAHLPVTMNGPRPEIDGKINGRDARFLLDSGAFFSLIPPGIAAENKLRLQPAGNFYISGAGGTAGASLTTVKALTLAGIAIPNIVFIVGGSEIGSSGVIGQNVLHLADVDYDLAHSITMLVRPSGCAGVNLAHWAKDQLVSVIALEENDSRLSHTIAVVHVNGQRVRALFDTGAPASILSLAAAARAGIRPNSPGVVPAGFAGGIGSRQNPQWIAPFASVKIGGEELRNTRLLIGDIGEDTEMLLGADFFLSHRIYVANSQNKIYFTYNGGPIFSAAGRNVRAIDAQGKPFEVKAVAADPQDAEGYSKRGMAAAARGDRKAGLADLDRAVAAAPQEPRYLVQRADIYEQLRQPELAEADVDKALALKPEDPDALIERATLRAAAGRRQPALADMDMAARLLDKASDSRFVLGDLYSSVDEQTKAIEQLDLWIAVHPVDSRRPIALNSRCWARALLGRELDRALADCTTAIRTIPLKEMALDSRGLVNLRAGNLAAAIKDYDAALALRPKMAWSLYGRGIARVKLGQKEAGEKDIAEARTIAPKLEDDARRYGITP